MCGVKCITFALWINILSVITDKNDFKVELTPRMPVNHVGADLELTCRVNACPVNVTFQWRVLLDNFHGGISKNEQTVSRLLIRNITVKHNIALVCKATCEGNSRENTSYIKVFSFPQDPVLGKIKSLIANQTQTLNCTVHNVYPVERIKIEWLRGDETLHVDDTGFPSDSVQSYSSVFNYTPSVWDLGKNISCKATLNITEIGLEKTRNSNAEYGPGTITLSNNNHSVKLGEHLEITCHADGNPKPTILWWKEETEPAQNKSQNEKLIINNASWSQAGWYRCDARNAVGSQQMRVKVIVLGPPNIPKIQLSHTGDPKEGENITILCSSDDGSAGLTLYRQSQSAVSRALNESAVLLNIPSVQITDGGIYICEAKNGVGTERSTINITVEAQVKLVKKPDLPVAILPVAILPAVGSVSLLTIAGLLIRYCRNKARTNSGDITLS
ncbi:vascular cell adhesion protein 1 [Rhinichthys klamathensis goyatoka]|uniref:vascular cell adhesion protein 1 n=1 Tax=Rhinichthys klamathensis goyatoka TaxID=3034132 RepID=UPI0024B61599|nr:vascular cell adhesion protein 1 [Rhinichthys klamathensis goyatoka]